MKKICFIKAQHLTALIKELNVHNIKRDDLVGIYPPLTKDDEYTAVFYHEQKTS